MSPAGVADLFRGRPRHPVGVDGRMALSDHFRELRARLLRVAVVLVLATAGGLFFYDQLLAVVIGPYQHAKEVLGAEVETKAYIKGATGPLMLQLKLAAVTGVVVTSPYWLHQVWGFILPGLHASERKWSRVFAAVAGPLFIAGVLVGYYVLPRGLEVLIGFTPDALENLVEFGEYFTFFTRMLLVFGVAFEIPLFVVMLNLAGVLPGRTLGRYRAWVIMGTFVFAAVATPSTDPFSMLMLALPMLVLFLLAEAVSRMLDRMRGRQGTEQWGDDEVSSL